MQLDAALPIVRALADGVNPVTGEAYPDHSPYAEPRTLRALYSAVDLMQKKGMFRLVRHIERCAVER